jgi:ketosteroid isomerase-like protein
MSESAQVAVVRRLYEARGNPDVIRQVLAPDIRWEVVEGFPYGGVYVGLDNVLRNFFGRLFQDFESFVAAGTEFLEAGDRVSEQCYRDRLHEVCRFGAGPFDDWVPRRSEWETWHESDNEHGRDRGTLSRAGASACRS